MKIFEHILIPYNGTSESAKSFKKAVAMASLFNAKISILTCIERRSLFALFKKKTKKEELDKEQEFVQREHKEMLEYARKQEVEASAKILRADYVSNEILEFAEQNEIDLIVLSKKKFTLEAEKMHYHSTLEGVTKNATCSVMIVH